MKDAELLAAVIGSGIPGRPARVLGEALLAEAGSLSALSRSSAAELTSVSGVGRAHAARLVAAFELGRRALAPPSGASISGPSDVYELLRPRLANLPVEVGIVLAMSAKNQILGEIEVARGEATAIPVHPREVFRPLIRHGAAGGIFVHNHPSGDPTPSEEDIALTRRLVSVGELVGIPLIDHVIVAAGGFRSLATQLALEELA